MRGNARIQSGPKGAAKNLARLRLRKSLFCGHSRSVEEGGRNLNFLTPFGEDLLMQTTEPPRRSTVVPYLHTAGTNKGSGIVRMKTKKALKRLNKVETLLSNIIDQFPGSKDGLRGLLDSAKATVARAMKIVNLQPPNGATAKKKLVGKAVKARASRLSAEGRKRISLAAKKRWATVKRKGVDIVTTRHSRKTA